MTQVEIGTAAVDHDPVFNRQPYPETAISSTSIAKGGKNSLVVISRSNHPIRRGRRIDSQWKFYHVFKKPLLIACALTFGATGIAQAEATSELAAKFEALQQQMAPSAR